MALLREANFTKADYENCSFWVGVHHDEDGNPLVVVDGKCIGTVDGVLKFVSQYQKNGGIDGRIAVLEARIDGIERDMPRRVIETVRSAQRANVKI